MLVLYETPAGYSLLKVMTDTNILKEPENLNKEFETHPKEIVNLHAFHKFEDTTAAVAAVTALIEGKLDKSLKSFLKKNIIKKNLIEELGVSDPKLGASIKSKLDISCVATPPVQELLRGIRAKFDYIVPEIDKDSMTTMALGLSHSLSRYKLKFSPDKVDTMIVQAINLLDELDKEINIYAMRAREWYGWHFPELNKIITDNLQFCKIVNKVGMRKNIKKSDLSDILSEDVEIELKTTCEISMGTDISEDDIKNISALCTQVISLSQYRSQLADYLKNRMSAVAPNLSIMVGDLVGARLIAHAGSLINLAKAPASTVQILGAEKALFRALKTKHDTPKYGLIYHASLIGQAGLKHKGKIARVLAAKTSLALRVDALGESSEATIGFDLKEKVEARIRSLDTGRSISLEKSTAKKSPKKYVKEDNEQFIAGTYNTSTDNTSNIQVIDPVSSSKKKKKSSSKDFPSSTSKKKKLDDSPSSYLSVENKVKKQKRSDQITLNLIIYLN